ncbi:unnamed protein product [Ectocarpus sp. 6 AP-2014]
MKRSRTCLNLFELDTPAAPKRTCSLPSNLGSFSSSSSSSSCGSSGSSFVVRQNQERLLFLQQHEASTLAQGTAAAPATIADGNFVVESIVRSQRSLNEITIHEGQQFIGQESNEAATAVPQQQSFAARVQYSEQQQQQQQQQQPLSLFGGAVIGSLFEDGGDSSDYFCGVDSSDEADEDRTVIAASAAAECATSTTCDSGRGAECARQVSDADDNNASCARQVSDSSSSSCSSISNGSSGSSGSSGSGVIGGVGAERYAFEGDDDGIIGTAADPLVDFDTAAAAGLSFSLPAAHHWGGRGGGGVVVPPQPLVAATGPHAGGSWQPAAAGAPREVGVRGGLLGRGRVCFPLSVVRRAVMKPTQQAKSAPSQ